MHLFWVYSHNFHNIRPRTCPLAPQTQPPSSRPCHPSPMATSLWKPKSGSCRMQSIFYAEEQTSPPNFLSPGYDTNVSGSSSSWPPNLGESVHISHAELELSAPDTDSQDTRYRGKNISFLCSFLASIFRHKPSATFGHMVFSPTREIMVKL